MRPCLGCGQLIRSGSRCPRCERNRFPASPGRLRGARWQEIRKGVLRAFAYRCSECGAEGIPLEVHHRDHDHTHNDLVNLLPLCRGCHRRAK
jgi:5-methylcytosine-specific restriction endonuclease McrA